MVFITAMESKQEQTLKAHPYYSHVVTEYFHVQHCSPIELYLERMVCLIKIYVQYYCIYEKQRL